MEKWKWPIVNDFFMEAHEARREYFIEITSLEPIKNYSLFEKESVILVIENYNNENLEEYLVQTLMPFDPNENIKLDKIWKDFYFAGRYHLKNELSGNFSYEGNESRARGLLTYRTKKMSIENLFERNDLKLSVKKLCKTFDKNGWIREPELKIWFKKIGVEVDEEGCFYPIKDFAKIMSATGEFSLHIEKGSEESYIEEMEEKFTAVEWFVKTGFAENFLKALRACDINLRE